LTKAIRTQDAGGDQAEGLTFDFSKIDLDKLRDEFAKKLQRKPTAIRDIRTLLEQSLADMLAKNPTRMDYQQTVNKNPGTRPGYNRAWRSGFPTPPHEADARKAQTNQRHRGRFGNASRASAATGFSTSRVEAIDEQGGLH
jgi:hypothetical protein